MKLKHFLLFSLILSIFACTSDDSNNDDDDPNQDDLLIKEIIYNYADDDGSYTETFSYDGNKLMSITDSSSDFDEVYSATLEYDNNRLSKISFFEDSELEESITLSYNSDNVLTNLEIFFPEVSSVPFNDSVTYTNNGGNITIDESEYIILNSNIMEESDSGRTLSYQYDTNNSIYKNIFDIELIILAMSRAENGFDIYGVNNNITQIIDNQDGFIDTETFSYTYNASNYPDTAMYFYDGALDLNVEFIYE